MRGALGTFRVTFGVASRETLRCADVYRVRGTLTCRGPRAAIWLGEMVDAIESQLPPGDDQWIARASRLRGTSI